MPNEVPKLTVTQQRDALYERVAALFAKMGVPLNDLNVRHSKEDLMAAVQEHCAESIVAEMVVLSLVAGGIGGYKQFEAEKN